MPKLRPTDKQRLDARLNEHVAVHLLRQQMTKSDLAGALNLSRNALWRKLKNPDYFTRGELRRLYAILHFTNQDIADCAIL